MPAQPDSLNATQRRRIQKAKQRPIPSDLADYDSARWHRAAEADPEPGTPTAVRAHDLYWRALRDAGVWHTRASELRAAAVMHDAERQRSTA